MIWTSVLEVTAVFTSDSIFSCARSLFLNARAQKGVRAVTKSNFWGRFDGANVIQKSWNLVCEHLRPSSFGWYIDRAVSRTFWKFFKVRRHLQNLWLIRSKISRRIWIRLFQGYCIVGMTFWLFRLFSGRKTRFLVENGHFCDFEAPSTVTLEARRSNVRVPSNSLWAVLSR